MRKYDNMIKRFGGKTINEIFDIYRSQIKNWDNTTLRQAIDTIEYLIVKGEVKGLDSEDLSAENDKLKKEIAGLKMKIGRLEKKTKNEKTPKTK